MTVAEMFSELLHAEIPLSVIAGMTDLQLVWILGRKRNDRGDLIRVRRRGAGEPSVTRPVGFEEMYRQTKRRQSEQFKGQVVNGRRFLGYTEEDIDRMWEHYLYCNPQLRRRVERERNRRVGRTNPRKS